MQLQLMPTKQVVKLIPQVQVRLTQLLIIITLTCKMQRRKMTKRKMVRAVMELQVVVTDHH
jgi:hypothetical protein